MILNIKAIFSYYKVTFISLELTRIKVMQYLVDEKGNNLRKV